MQEIGDSFNPFNPQLLPWTLPSLNLNTFIVEIGVPSKLNNRMANSVVPVEMACYEPSHLDLHCLHRQLC